MREVTKVSAWGDTSGQLIINEYLLDSRPTLWWKSKAALEMLRKDSIVLIQNLQI